MWANVQRDGRPAKYRWRPLLKLRSAPQILADAPTRVPCNNAVNIGQRNTWTHSEYCTWQNSVTGQVPPKMNM